MFHHQSTPDVSQLPTGAYLVRRKLGSIEGYLVYDDFDTQVYRFKGHLAFPGQRWSMVDGAGTGTGAGSLNVTVKQSACRAARVPLPVAGCG